MDRNPPYDNRAVVIGGNVNGLSSVRELGRAGIPVSLIVDSTDAQPAADSRYVRDVRVLPELRDRPSKLVDVLEALSSEFRRPPVVFTGSDIYLNEIGRAWNRVAACCHLPYAGAETIALIGNKSAFYRFALQHGVSIAPTAFVRDTEDLEKAITDLRFPLLLKPSEATPAWRARGWKVLPLHDVNDARCLGTAALQLDLPLVLQEIIPGGDDCLHFYFGYLDDDGQPLGEFTGRKLRQDAPRFGISSLAESTVAPGVVAAARAVLEKLGYRGYGSVEFKRDPRDGALYVTEVTGRMWYPHALSAMCGVPLLHLAYCHQLGLPLPPVATSWPAGVKWVDEIGDLHSASTYWREGELSIVEWAKSYRGVRRGGLYMKGDALPAVKFATRFLRALPARAVRRLARLKPDKLGSSRDDPR